MGREKALILVEGETLLARAVRFWNLSGLADRILLSVGSPNRLQFLEPLPERAEPICDFFEDSGPMAASAGGTSFLRGQSVGVVPFR